MIQFTSVSTFLLPSGTARGAPSKSHTTKPSTQPGRCTHHRLGLAMSRRPLDSLSPLSTSPSRPCLEVLLLDRRRVQVQGRTGSINRGGARTALLRSVKSLCELCLSWPAKKKQLQLAHADSGSRAKKLTPILHSSSLLYTKHKTRTKNPVLTTKPTDGIIPT